MKKMTSIFLAVILCCTMLAGCASKDPELSIVGQRLTLSDAVLSGTVASSTAEIKLSDYLTTSKGFSIKVFTDEGRTNEHTNTASIPLEVGENTYYLRLLSSKKVASGDYTLSIYRNGVYTVRFLADKEGEVLSSASIEEGERATAPASPTSEIYDFAGWRPSTEVSAVNVATYSITDNTDFVAMWVIKEGIGLVGRIELGTDELGQSFKEIYPKFDFTEVEVTIESGEDTIEITPLVSGEFVVVQELADNASITVRHDLFVSKTATFSSSSSLAPFVLDRLKTRINGKPAEFSEAGATDFIVDEFGNITHSGSEEASYIENGMSAKWAVSAKMGFNGSTDPDARIGFVITNGTPTFDSDRLEIGIYLVNRPAGIGVMLQAFGPNKNQPTATYYHDSAEWLLESDKGRVVEGDISTDYVTFTLVKEGNAMYYFINGVFSGRITSDSISVTPDTGPGGSSGQGEVNSQNILLKLYGQMGQCGVGLSAQSSTGEAQFSGLSFTTSSKVINNLIDNLR